MSRHATPTVAFVGMTHLGLVSATATASKGFSVIGLDDSEELVKRIKAGDLPVREPGLKTLIAENGNQQRFTSDFSLLKEANVVYIAADVPTDRKGVSNLSSINALVSRVIDCLAADAILIILCQVPPGFTRKLNVDKNHLFYQVETLIFGRAVERATKPERLIVGCSNPRRPLPRSYLSILEVDGCPILPMQYESAELAKIAINMCLVASISVANTMSEICEQIGADWAEIVPSLLLDHRIGAHSYLLPGLGLGGGNLERDLASLISIGDRAHTDTSVPKAWIKNSQHRRDWAVREVKAAHLSEGRLAVWGLTYKENTHSTKNSPALATLEKLPNATLRVHDPAVSAEVVNHDSVIGLSEPLETLRESDALLILAPWPVYADIRPMKIRQHMSGRLIIDPYRVLSPLECQKAGLEWRALGSPTRSWNYNEDAC